MYVNSFQIIVIKMCERHCCPKMFVYTWKKKVLNESRTSINMTCCHTAVTKCHLYYPLKLDKVQIWMDMAFGKIKPPPQALV